MSIDEQIRSAVRAELAAFIERMEQLIRSGAVGQGDELLTVKQAAALAKVKPATVRRWIREGLLAPRGRARGLRVSRAQLLGIPGAPPKPADAARVETPQAKAARLLRGN